MAEESRFKKWLDDTVFNPLEDKKMPVMQHLFEFQARLTKIVIIVALFFVGTFFYADTLVQWLRVPLQNMFVPGDLAWSPTDLPKIPFVFLSPAEALWQNLKVAGLFALVLATPYILWEVWAFVVPGLHSQERRFVAPFVITSAVAFYLGLSFSFFFVLPFALNFLISYGVQAGFIPQISIASYVGFSLWFLLIFGLVFEVPLAITLMAKLGWVDVPFLKKYRKWAFLGAFLFAAILTPTPDPFNQCLMALPMYFFYEVGIISAGFFKKPKTEEEESDAQQPAETPKSGSGGLRPQTAAAGTSGGDDDYVGVP
ncbi:MAG: twin-arginine translocase subunit TatC [Nitrospirae bacterium]|nr:twin-arginine translocase subunit TatC [Nitrospirota bacterium]MDA1303782.1 twin-arginine translocase subunit TatC [Nitrospirota bacterium]